MESKSKASDQAESSVVFSLIFLVEVDQAYPPSLPFARFLFSIGGKGIK